MRRAPLVLFEGSALSTRVPGEGPAVLGQGRSSCSLGPSGCCQPTLLGAGRLFRVKKMFVFFLVLSAAHAPSGSDFSGNSLLALCPFESAGLSCKSVRWCSCLCRVHRSPASVSEKRPVFEERLPVVTVSLLCFCPLWREEFISHL